MKNAAYRFQNLQRGIISSHATDGTPSFDRFQKLVILTSRCTLYASVRARFTQLLPRKLTHPGGVASQHDHVKPVLQPTFGELQTACVCTNVNTVLSCRVIDVVDGFNVLWIIIVASWWQADGVGQI